ncbi:MAG: MBOAT family protein [Chitinophagales bacterium]|nr:MBOAT family protein [Chitinophagales bacterium]
MLFNSFEFLLFLPIVFCLYWFVFNKSLRWQNLLILTASYFFYGWWSTKFLALLALSTLLDYSYGFWVASTNKKKAKLFLWLSIINNLGILGVFKYYNFFATQIQTAFESIGIHTNPTLLHVALPIGISFYTFHGMSYVFDIYRGHQKPVSSFIDYAVFVSFFPLLVAGPIERANHLLPQVQRKRTFRYVQAVEGSRLILWGMFKKVIIADTISSHVDLIFNHYDTSNAFSLILGVIAFSFQIYCDFSGYSDIALGTAKLFGFELLSNFRFPYFSRDIAEFWRRWHISLSSWFRDYLYIPLGGSREGKAKAVRNTFIKFLVSGFWHGASWNFIIWGGIHAACFLPFLLTNRNRRNVTNVVAQNTRLPNLKELRQMLLTFAFVALAWIFFRAPDLHVAISYIRRIFTDSIQNPKQYLHLPPAISTLAYIIPLVVIDWSLRRDERNLRVFNNKTLRYLVYIIMIIMCYLYIGKTDSTFIYFQF